MEERDSQNPKRDFRRRDFRGVRPKEEFDSKLLHLTRISHMKAGGRRFRFRAIVVIGDGKGRVGLGISKGKDVSQAVEKAKKDAKKNLITVPILKETIPYQVEAKFSSVKILLKPQAKGKGLLAGGPVRIVCNLAGIKNISSKLLSPTKSKMNIAMATMKALGKLRVE
jgi:small subunit ribosomal protein S5